MGEYIKYNKRGDNTAPSCEVSATPSVDGYCFSDYTKAKANAFKFGAKIKRYLSTKNGNQNDARNGNQNDSRLKKEEAHNAASSWDESSYDPRVININDFWDD